MATVYILYNSNSLWQHNYHTIPAPAMSSFAGDGKIIFIIIISSRIFNQDIILAIINTYVGK